MSINISLEKFKLNLAIISSKALVIISNCAIKPSFFYSIAKKLKIRYRIRQAIEMVESMIVIQELDFRSAR